MEGARYALNKRTGNTALAEYSIRNVAGFGRQEYSCLECGEKLILKKGEIKKPHFAHEAQDKECSYYSKNSAELDERTKIKHSDRIHQIAIQELKKLLEDDYKINPMRRCSAKGGCKNYTTDVVQLEHKHSHTVYKTEYPIMHDGKKRILDLARIDEGKIKYTFEILDCHRTTEDSRPTEYEWFEILADDVIKIRSEIDSMNYDITEGIEIDCQREIFKCRECFETEKQLLLIEEERKRIILLELAEKERLRLIELKRKQNEELERIKIKELVENARLQKLEDEKERNRIKLLELAKKELKDKEEERLINIRLEWNRCIQEAQRKERSAREEVLRQERLAKEEVQRQEQLALKEVQRQEQLALKEVQRQEQKIIEIEKRKEIEKERIIKEKELENLNKKCKACNFNHCKCKEPNFNTNEHNVIWCTSCKKRKCMCTRIKKFYKNM